MLVFLLGTISTKAYDNNWRLGSCGTNIGERVVGIIKNTGSSYSAINLFGEIVDFNGNWGQNLPTVSPFSVVVKFSGGFTCQIKQVYQTSNIILKLRKVSETEVHLIADFPYTHKGGVISFGTGEHYTSFTLLESTSMSAMAGEVIVAEPSYGVSSFNVKGNVKVADDLTVNNNVNVSGYIYKVNNEEQTLIKSERTDGSWDATLKTDGRGNFIFNRKVGIGENSPSAKLDVAGNIKVQEIEVTLASMQDLNLNGTLAANNITYTANGQTADHVFEEDYDLKSLEEIETFITENKHLPDVPSAEEMEEEGVNLAEMNKLLLQKVEELTLYIISQEKRIKELEKNK
nr:hypothetical protein [uncultured Carboxylicivirga sp.]